jgi:hypothetical protein
MAETRLNRREFLIAGGALLAARQLRADADVSHFADPPWEARPSTYWVWLNGFTDRRSMTRELEELKKAGISAVYILEIGARAGDRVPAGPAYMGTESLQAIAHAVREAGRLGMEVGLTNASSWNSGGSWVGPNHASKGLYWSRMTVQGPATFSEALPFPKLPAPVPRNLDGSPAYYNDVAVLALSAEESWPGFDFVFDLAPGTHTVNRVTLHNAASDSSVKEFVIYASESGSDAADFREAFRGTLQARTGAQSFTIPPARAKFLKLRVVSGHDPGGRVALAEFEAFSADANVVTVQTADGRKTVGGLVRFTTEAGLEREWMAENIYDGRSTGPEGSWAAVSGAPPLVRDPSEILDLTSRLDAHSRLTWDFPAGKWIVYRFIAANNGEKLKAPSPHSDGFIIDHFSADAARMHTRHMLERLRAELGDLRKTALKYFYACSYEVRGSIWTPNFIEEFRRRRGYDPRRYLPVLAGAVVADEDVSERFRIDYRRTVSDLFIDNFYRVTRETASEYGLKLVAEAGGPGWPLHQVPVDALRAQGALDIPRGEFWKGRQTWVVKETASAAHIYGQPLVQMEAFTSFRHWQDGPRDIKEIADRAFCDGANHFVWHTMPHVPEQAGKPGWVYHAGTHFGPNETWWPMVNPFLDYLARCSWFLRQGLFVADICYYYGERGFNFAPEKSSAAEIGLPTGYDFDTTNSDALLNRIVVKNRRLVLPDGLSYEVLVLPDRRDLDVEVLERIEQLVREGATVSGPSPRRATGLRDYPDCDARVRDLASRLWGDCDGARIRERAHGKGMVYCGVSIAEILRRRGLRPDFSFSGRGGQIDLDYIHRRDGPRDIYFVRNKGEEWAAADCVFRAKGPAELWDPVTGVRRLLPASGADGGGTRVPLVLPPLGSSFVVFDRSTNSEPLTIVRDGQAVAANMAIEHLPSVEVSMPDQDRVKLLSFSPGSYRVRAGRQSNCTLDRMPPAVEIAGPWDVRFGEGWGAPVSTTFPRLVSWTENTEPGIKYFSGIATYSKTVDLPGELFEPGLRLFLDLGDVRVIARLRLNGKEAGICWTRPFRLEITQAADAGTNRLEVEVANTWSNRLTGQALSEASELARTNARWNKSTPLLASGLLGPVRILPAREAEIRL